MKKLLSFLVVAILSVTAAHAEKGDMAAGVNLLYGTEIESFGIGAKYQYEVIDRLRLEGSFNYFFERKNIHGWDLNVTAMYLFPLSSSFTLYPLAGPTIANAGSYGNTTTKFGLNLGGGCEYNINYNWKINLDIRYSIVSDIDQAVIGIGGAYKF